MPHKYDVVIVGLNVASSVLLLKKLVNSSDDVLILTSLDDVDAQLCGLSLVDYFPHAIILGRSLSNFEILKLTYIDSRPNIQLVRVRDLGQVKIHIDGDLRVNFEDQEISASRVIVCSEYRPADVRKLLNNLERAVRSDFVLVTSSDVFKLVEVALLLRSIGVRSCLPASVDVRQYVEHEVANLVSQATSTKCSLELYLDLGLYRPLVKARYSWDRVILLGHGFTMTDRPSGIRYACMRDLDLLVRSSTYVLNPQMLDMSLPYVNAVFTPELSIVQLGMPRTLIHEKYRDLSSTRVCKDKLDGRVCVRMISWRGKLLSIQVTCIGQQISMLAEYYLDSGLCLLVPDARYVPLFRIQDVIRGYAAPEPLGTCIMNMLA